MNRYPNLLESGPVSHVDAPRSDFEFPTSVPQTGAVPNDVVFCGKVISRQTELGPAPQASAESEKPLGRANGFTAWSRSPSGRENRCRRSDSCRKRYNGMFGTVKFPLQMELSDIKMRQERREPMPLSKVPVEENGGDSCWELVRPLRRRGNLLSALLAKVSFRCMPIV
ncbi:hypothetical protein SESBI_36524 [Sesbania bispinosa]|nr:hypothetical protein SESBI_36524 [Sesbania bispinosa]